MESVIDAHQHLWEMSRFNRPWLGGTLARDFSLDDYKAATQGLSFEAAIYVETGVAPEDRDDEAHWILALRRRDETVAGAVISGDPWEEKFADSLVKFAADPGLKGVRTAIHRRSCQSPLLNEPFLQATRLLGAYDLCCDLLIGRDELKDATALAERRPDTRFILNHCGGPGSYPETREAWKKCLATLAQRPNIFCKVSGIVGLVPPGLAAVEYLAPIVRHCAETFGPERLLFGTDWPVCTQYASIAEWKRLLDDIVADWSEADKRSLFHDNAVRIYRL